MMRFALTISLSLFLFFDTFSQSLEMTVFDVGAGLCVVSSFPNEETPTDPYYMIYDAGFHCIEHVQSLIPSSQEIDLMVLSHNDTDHIATADTILAAYQVNQIIWSGFERPEIQSYVETSRAIENEPGAKVINLKSDTIAIGSTLVFGNTYVTFVSGFHEPPERWGFSPSERSEYRNAGSIMMRVTYEGKSILMTGDMIGRHEDGDHSEEHVIAAEKYVIDNRHAVPIRSDVLIASHHGGNDASSYPFIRAVSPQFVIFSAGSHDNYGHPREAVAQRFLNSGVEYRHIFRTDLADDESRPDHWENESTQEGVSDSTGDDHVEIKISGEGTVSVGYIAE